MINGVTVTDGSRKITVENLPLNLTKRSLVTSARAILVTKQGQKTE